MDEDDALWTLRKRRHRHQAELERRSRSACLGEGRTFYQCHYEPTFGCALEERIGNFGDGGKWVCDPVRIRSKAKEPQGGCLVYSVGSNGDFSFETSVHQEISSRCEIHTVDMNPWQNYGEAPPSFVSYHVYTLGDGESQTSFPEIVRQLNHTGREIDILKVDCEGCEWETYMNWLDAGVTIRQILVELHGVDEAVHALFAKFASRGYVVFQKEPNTVGCQGDCIEYAFLRLDPSFQGP